MKPVVAEGMRDAVAFSRAIATGDDMAALAIHGQLSRLERIVLTACLGHLLATAVGDDPDAWLCLLEEVGA